MLSLTTAQAAWALASGGTVGFALALVGGGGSILAVPALLYLVGLNNTHLAIGTSALAVAVNAFANVVNDPAATAVSTMSLFCCACTGTTSEAMARAAIDVNAHRLFLSITTSFNLNIMQVCLRDGQNGLIGKVV